MRIHLVGSVPNNDYDRSPAAVERGLAENPEFFAAAADIGRIAANRGHTLIVGGTFKLTADYHAVINGMLPIIKNNPLRTFHLEVWRPNDPERPYEELCAQNNNLKIDYFVARPGFPQQQRQNPRKEVINTNLWTFAHQSALANSDVVLAMGGTDGTERAALMAEQLGVPTLPLRCFGGGAERAYTALERDLIELPGAHALSAKWSDRHAQDIIELAEKVGTHSYFLSYSHQHIEWCDLVHLALYTRGRVVLRDRDELSVGREVQPKLMAAIGKAETFVLLWSKEAAESSWCRMELERAIKLQQAGLPPRRIIMLRRDRTDPPPELQNQLWLEAFDCRQTDDAVNRIVAQETTR